MGNPKNSIFIGDGGHNELYGAFINGMKTIKVNWFVNRIKDEILNYANYQVGNIREVSEIIKNIK